MPQAAAGGESEASSPGSGAPSVAIVHDYLTQRGGAERVVLSMHRAFPSAPIYTSLYDPQGTFPEFENADVRPSWLNRVPSFRNDHRLALPLLPFAASTTHVPEDIAIVSSSGWAHGFRISGHSIVYCYSPARWLYQSDAYLGENAPLAQRAVLGGLRPVLRRWDTRAAARADVYLAISHVVKDRIRDTYNIDAEILPAPHTLSATGEQSPVPMAAGFPTAWLLCVSRLLPYKNVDQVIQAFRGRDEGLVVVGRGPEKEYLRQLAPPNVLFLEDIHDAELRWLYASCEAVVAASYEDYGLTPLEAGVHGKPALALRWGGFLDTIEEGVTGCYFDQPVADQISEGLDTLLSKTWSGPIIRHHTEQFAEPVFTSRLRAIVSRAAAGL